jgi:predicted HTH transcriptional regulator
MEPFPDLTDKDVFPSLESSTMEFKEGIVSCPTEKIHATVCGFLNNKGGHLVFGVTDTGQIKGLRGSSKDIDAQLLRLDNMYHLKMITLENGDPIPAGTIQTSAVTVKSGGGEKRIIVVTAKPEAEKRYKLRDGSMWYRLSASNYRVQHIAHAQEMQRLAAELDIAKQEAEVAKQQKTLMRDAMRVAQKHATDVTEQLAKLREDAARLLAGAQKADQALAMMTRALEADILARKGEVEKKLEAEKGVPAWWQRIFCCSERPTY